MQQGSDSDDFRIVLSVLKLSDSFSKKPRADNMVEQVGFTFLPRIFDRPANELRIGNRNSCKHPTSDLDLIHGGRRIARMGDGVKAERSRIPSAFSHHYAAVLAASPEWKKTSRSAFIVAACVVGQPCGKPL